jgi:hypothetical protein
MNAVVSVTPYFIMALTTFSSGPCRYDGRLPLRSLEGQ